MRRYDRDVEKLEWRGVGENCSMVLKIPKVGPLSEVSGSRLQKCKRDTRLHGI